MSDSDQAGNPISYMVLDPGTPVFSSDDAEVGKVEKVLSVPAKDVFDGVVIAIPGGSRFIDADYIGRIYERRLELKITADEVASQPEHETGGGAYDAEIGKRSAKWRSE